MTIQSIVAAPKVRLLSLDVMRGLTIASMILVNNPGDWGHVYAPLEHSVWNGCTPTDLIFPFFLFMAGVSIVFAMESKKDETANHGKLILVAFRRFVTLLIISWLIQLFFHHSITHLRYPGVLQRIGLVFFICSVLYIKTTQKTRDWLLAFALIGYYIIMVWIPVPGQGYATLEPETNMGAWLDRLVFGTNHLWRESKTWDPEGLLGTLPALGTGLLGIRVGSWLKRPDHESSVKVSWMFTYGVLCVVLALIWDLFFPINKALWTSSFVLYAGGLAIIALAFCYWVIDVQGYKKYAWFFVVFGMNSIFAYILSDLLSGLIDFIPGTYHGKVYGGTAWFFQAVLAPNFSPFNASVIRAIIYVLMNWAVMLFLYRKKIYIRV